jgi:hypothetical protein
LLELRFAQLPNVDLLLARNRSSRTTEMMIWVMKVEVLPEAGDLGGPWLVVIVVRAVVVRNEE